MSIRRMATTSVLLIISALVLSALITGCSGSLFSGPGGTIRAETLAEAAVGGIRHSIEMGDLRTAVYTYESGADTSIYVSDQPIDALLDGTVDEGQVLHVELLWEPKAGATPMDDAATNVSLHYVIFVNGELGVYSGAGFARPANRPGDDVLTLDLRDSTLRLVASTPGFVDQLGPLCLTGRLSAELDDRAAASFFRTISQLVTNALGRSTWI